MPKPNSYTINLGRSIESGPLTSIPVLAVEFVEGRERGTMVEALSLFNASTIIAGDVHIEGT